MNRIKTIVSFLFIGLLTFSMASGQEKKDRKTVKVVVADKSGTKVLIDTTYSDESVNDSILLKNGRVIIIGNNEYNIDNKPGSMIEVFADVKSDGEKAEHRYVYMNDGKASENSSDKIFNLIVEEDESDTDADNSTYIIAKNGITVTIEGKNDAKIKDLAEEIKKKLEMIEQESDQAVK